MWGENCFAYILRLQMRCNRGGVAASPACDGGRPGLLNEPEQADSGGESAGRAGTSRQCAVQLALEYVYRFLVHSTYHINLYAFKNRIFAGVTLEGHIYRFQMGEEDI